MGGVICIYVVIDISIDIDIFLIISACVSSSPAFYKMCFAYKLNKQGDNIVVSHPPPLFQTICSSISGSHCCFLTWIQVSQEEDRCWYFHVFKKVLQFVVIHTVDFAIVNEAEIDFFFFLILLLFL